MTKKVLILLTAIVFAAAGNLIAQHSEHPPSAEQEKKPLYTCPMHPEIVRAEPGQCPKCGMTLVPLKEKKAERRTPNAEHPMSNSEEGHNADGMAMPEHHHGADAEHEMEMHSSIN